MINTVLQEIERFEASQEFEAASFLPTHIHESNGTNEIDAPVYVADDTSDDSDEYTDAGVSSGYEEIKVTSDQVHIKQSLKDKIRIRRESEGVGEIGNLFEPPKQYQLTPEEELKNEIRRQRNRKSATKSRLKRIAKEKQLEKDAEELEAEFEKRKKEVNILKKVKLLFSQILQRHLPSCPKVLATLNSAKLVEHIPTEPTSSTAAVTLPEAYTVTDYNRMTQSSKISRPLKRKSVDDATEPNFKIPKLWNQTRRTNLNSTLVSSVPRSCQSNTFNETWLGDTRPSTSKTDSYNSVQSDSMATEMDIQCNTVNESIPVLSEISNTSSNIPATFPGANNSHGLPTYAAAVYGIGLKTKSSRDSANESVNTNITEEQKINQIKEHLLDGFPMVPCP